MRTTTTYGLLLLCLSTLASCISVQKTMLGPERYAPRDPTSVRVYMSEADIRAPFVKIALLHAAGDSNYTNESQMVEKAREETAALGGNGLIMGGIDEPSAGAKVAGAVFGVATTRRGQMVAVLVEDGSKPLPVPTTGDGRGEQVAACPAKACERLGECTSTASGCLAATDADCARSKVCRMSGKCRAVDGACLK
jgi:hypothetical protein